MVRIHDDAAMAKRSNISLAILIAVFLYGIWELWHAAAVSGDTTDYIFGVLFFGGAIYGTHTMLVEIRDLVITFDVDPASGQAAISLWRPFRMTRLGTSLDQITGWRHWIHTGTRGKRAYFLLAEDPSHPVPLRFELRPGKPIDDALRKIAPEAIAEFEREVAGRAQQ